jgi:penicillin amidase
MRSRTIGLFALLLAVFPAPAASVAQETRSMDVPGLDHPVEVLVDAWGISHIYAETEHDLFFAQGWNAARDRLFQLEIWRRQATGTVAEILGPRELQRDHGTRLFRFRGDLEEELRHYHPRGVEIVGAFVDGINAYIGLTEDDPALLPLEFGLLGIRPRRWTSEVVVSRHQGLLGNIGTELRLGRAVADLGAEQVRAVSSFGPGEPVLALDSAILSGNDYLSIPGGALGQDILGVYNAFRRSLRFLPEDIAPEHRGDAEAFALLEASAAEAVRAANGEADQNIGSNNWVVSGRLAQAGYPIMANDPHRTLAVPSLRYWVHLVAPGWNVIGGGEPGLPGVSIGHNEFGAWGLTVFATDGEDLYVYDTNPRNPDEYWYQGQWEGMTVLEEEIAVEGEASYTARLKYSRHGPVVFEDSVANKAYAVRAAWMEIGGAPYLASLRMDQATTWEEFVDACTYSNIPGENMIWADRSGNIGWQAVGIAPVRRNWSGLVPVPGDGRYEWDGYLPIRDKPHLLNPASGYFATANNDLIPPDYPHMEAVGFVWTAPYRWMRISEVLESEAPFSMDDMMRLQTDELSIPARRLVPLLGAVSSDDARVEEARALLLSWDYTLEESSAEAGLYVEWESQLRQAVNALLVPSGHGIGMGLERVLQELEAPGAGLGTDPGEERDRLLVDALGSAVAALTAKLGGDMRDWIWGQADYHHAYLRHPLGRAVDSETRALLEVGPMPRGGYGSTVNQTTNGDNQTSGASFRIIVDTGDWDRSVGMNSPGQSGDPLSPRYRNLFEDWANDRFHPVLFSRERIEAATDLRIDLRPGG